MSIPEILSLDQWILLLLYAPPKQSVRSRLHLQKALFLLSNIFHGLKDNAEFIPYREGPYSENVEERLGSLEDYQYVEFKDRQILLKEVGKEEAEKTWKILPDNVKKAIVTLKDFVESLEEDELLLYVYVLYEETSEKSEIYHKIMRRRKEIALKMLNRGVVSVSLAAKLAGISPEDLLEEAKRLGIRPYELSVKDIDLA